LRKPSLSTSANPRFPSGNVRLRDVLSSLRRALGAAASSLRGPPQLSPMDFALDAPGVLEGLLLCTAHEAPKVRSAAQAELLGAARGDAVASLAKRLLARSSSGTIPPPRLRPRFVDKIESGPFVGL